VAERPAGTPNPHEHHFEARREVLGSLGNVQRLTHPESRLAFAAHKAESKGKRALHLAFGAPHEVYLTPLVTTAVVPLWGYPDIPAQDICRNTRQNWSRVISRADAVFVGAEATAQAFRDGGVSTPITCRPMPVPSAFLTLPDWSEPARVVLNVPHQSWGGPRLLKPTVEETEPEAAPVPPPAPRPHPVRALPGRAKRLAARTVRHGYHQLIRRWISDEAHTRLKSLKRTILRQPRPISPPRQAPDGPALPLTGELRLGGLTFLARVDYTDPGTNETDLLTAFLIAYRSRPDATLVLSLATTPEREHHDVWRISHHYEMLKITHECRVVVVLEPESPADRAALMQAAKYVLDTRRTAREAWFVTSALAAGRPVIACDHSSLRDWVSPEVGFVVRSSEEPAAWPHHPEERRESLARRIDWADLRNQLASAGRLGKTEYEALSRRGREVAESRGSFSACQTAWSEAIAGLRTGSTQRLEWAG
jgi:hypothetical protein